MKTLFHRFGLTTWFEAWAGILFLPRLWAGLLLGLLSCLRPEWAAHAFVAVLAGRLFLKLSGEVENPTPILSNCLLSGLFCGTLFQLSFSSVVLAAAAGLLTALPARLLQALLAKAGLPLLSLPYALVSPLIAIAASRHFGLYSLAWEDARLWPQLESLPPEAVQSFLHALGSVVFMGDLPCGAVIFALLLMHSRLLALHALLAFAWGVFLHGLLGGNFIQSLHDPFNFNFILVGITLGAIFVTPSWKSLVLSLSGVAACVLLIDASAGFASGYRISIFSLPFNLVTMLSLACLRLGRSPELPALIQATPEATAASEGWRRRCYGDTPALGLPCEGPLKVYQGFDGAWTHQGVWRHALDFVGVCDGRSFRQHGLSCSDYLIFGAELRAPEAGTVLCARDDLADNLPGQMDAQDNWGNHLILRRDDGLCLEFSHLQQGSLQVRPGERVRPGQGLARCGNSGYSAYPHLHLHLQGGEGLGAPTRSFVVEAWIEGENLFRPALPQQDQVIRLPRSGAVPGFLLPGAVSLVEDAEGKRHLWTLRRDDLARPQLLDEAGNRLVFRLFAWGAEVESYAGSPKAPLALLAAAMPRLLFAESAISWFDEVPAGALPRRPGMGLAAGLFPGLGRRRGSWRQVHPGQLIGRLDDGRHSLVELNAHGLISKLELASSTFTSPRSSP